uniref:Glycosyltransferase n=1 Tax=Tetradesmus obliquus TaxID=3088 RepID=A0A383VHY9_TETOB|eukprot:jgi/Sobl393_1/5079/SZX75927.1
MASILFACIPDQGHLHPLTAVAAQLAKHRSCSVAVASLEQARSGVEKAGLAFISLGSFSDEEASEHARLTRAVFDAGASFTEKLFAVTTAQVEMAGGKMAAGLFQHLEQARSAGSMPDVLVTDNLTVAGYEAAEQFQLPLAVLAQYPLSQSLLMAGLNSYNYPSDVPLESMPLNFSAHTANPLLRYVVSPALKSLTALASDWVFKAARNRLRAQLGMPRMVRGGVFALQEGVPRSLFICGASWELNAKRPLPDNWQLVGPMGVDYSAPGSFPPQLGDKDAQAQQFLQDAQAAGENVIYVATGTMVVLTQHQINAMAEAFQTLAADPNTDTSTTTSSSSSKPVRVIWSLKEATQQMLPEELRSSQPAEQGGSSSRVLVLPWFNQAAVLAHPAVKLFVSHGGLGSTNEGLSAGKPIVCMPFSGDQPTIAQQLVDRGVGVRVDPVRLTAARMVAAVQQVLQDERCSHTAAAMGERLRSSSGAGTAAQLLLQFAAAGSS